MLIDKLQQENIFPVFGVAVLDTDGRVDNNAVYQSYEVRLALVSAAIIHFHTERMPGWYMYLYFCT